MNNFKNKKSLRNIHQKTLSNLQKIGRSLMFPIAVLPVAALFLRFGILMSDTKLVGINAGNIIWHIGTIFKTVGSAILDAKITLPALFAIGIAFGMSKDNRGEAALIGFFTWAILNGLMMILPENFYGSLWLSSDVDDKSLLLYTWTINSKGEKVVSYNINMATFGGVISGVIASSCYNKFKDIKLPPFLSFFSGKRFVPLVVVLFIIPISILIALIWPWIQYGLTKFGQIITPKKIDNSTRHIQWIVATIHAVINRLLIPFGLTSIVSGYFFYQHPFTSSSGKTIFGDIPSFLSVDDLVPGAGLFQSGFFPIMMFGLPAVSLAIIYCAKKERRNKVVALFLGSAVVCFLTGVTEPLEFSFIYVAPILFLVHVLLSGIITAITVGIGIRIGFGFSAGLIDYILSFYSSIQVAQVTWKSGLQQTLANPGWIIPIGLLSAACYFFIFTYLIKKFNYQTIGREENENVQMTLINKKDANYHLLAEKILAIIGQENIINVNNCITRVRIEANNIDDEIISKLSHLEFVKGSNLVGKKQLQIIIGPDAQFVSEQLKNIILLNNKNER